MTVGACQPVPRAVDRLPHPPGAKVAPPHLAAMETLVDGLAHEVNNPLAATLSGVGFVLEVATGLRDRIRRGDRIGREEALGLLQGVTEALEDAQEGGRRVSRIVRDLSVIGHPHPGRSRVRLIDVVDGALAALPTFTNDSLTIQVENLGAPDVLASNGQLERLVVNLLVNAAKARAHHGDGGVVIRVGPGTAGGACLEVADDGTGIDPAIVGRIFEPFFTTREPGQGMGLGLAVCHAIAAAHGGSLTVESTPGEGSTFRLELPAVLSPPAGSASRAGP